MDKSLRRRYLSYLLSNSFGSEQIEEVRECLSFEEFCKTNKSNKNNYNNKK